MNPEFRTALRSFVTWAAFVLLLTDLASAGAHAQQSGDVFSSSGNTALSSDAFGTTDRQCGYPGMTVDMSKIVAAAQGYPNSRIYILTPQERAQLQQRMSTWNQGGGQPMYEMAPCFTCSQLYEACIVFSRDAGPPLPDSFASNGGGQPGETPGGDQFASTSQSEACRNNPQSYTCLYGHPTGPSTPGGIKYGCPPDYSNQDNPGAAPETRYGLGFSQSARQCVAEQATIENLEIAVLGARFKQVGALLMVMAAPNVIDGVLHPPGTSRNPNPYLQGREEGRRLCEWGLKVSPVLVARCPAKTVPSKSSSCSIAQLSNGYGIAAAAAQSHAPARFDCFPCSLAWVLDEPYVAPADGGSPWDLEHDIIPLLKQRFGQVTPQGAALPCWRQGAQAKGYPGSMSIPGIEREMLAAGDGARGILLWKGPGNDPGHVIGVKTVGSGNNAQVVFWDPQQQMNGSLWFPTLEGTWTTFYRIR